MSDTLDDYKQRQREWRNLSTTQLSVTNNILTTVATGYFALAFDRDKLSKFTIDLDSKIEWPLTLYYLTLLLILLSIIYGVLVMFSRLYDFRLSRHIALTRQRIYKKYNQALPDSDEEFNSIGWTDRLKGLCYVLFSKINFLSQTDINSFKGNQKSFKKDFNFLRRQSQVLGTASWRWTKIQVGLAILSIVTYLIHLTW